MDQQLPSVDVLVVDDSTENREVLADLLEHHGATVTAVETADRALVLLEQLRPDVLLSDLEMPGHDGYWLIGFQYHIPKPVDMSRLIGIVGILALKP